MDVIYEGDRLAVIAELSGADNKDIETFAAGKKLTISARNSTHKYHKEIELDYSVKDEFETTYRNGILEIKLVRAKGK
ncbi:MAG: hypothetical protein QGH66_06230 [Dehalococcoidia bacterium]|jgi:HSP20 family molecular chaperone IbpA|nr:hypothetical protein [Dehalococcoidia bacterium]